MMTSETTQSVPLFVDLDGTLIKTDLLAESALVLLKQAPWMIFVMPLWLLRGKAYLKARIAEHVSLATDTLPLQTAFVAFLQSQQATGRPLYLATAADARLAQPMADRLGIFRGVLASDGIHNLRSKNKLAAIAHITGGGCFDYAGNARADFPIWAKARQAIVVNPGLGVLHGARVRTTISQVFEDRPPLWRLWIKQTRLHQWMKNLLIGVPLLTSHAFNTPNLVAVALAFIAFGLVASATYMLNDLLDLASDRKHPRKCRRPFAAGNLGIAPGCIVMALLLLGGLLLAASLAPSFLLILLGYLLLTLAYTFYAKQLVLIDVLMLALLYTIRIMAGAMVINVAISSWLLAFSMFTFLSLALIKRRAELGTVESLERTNTEGRDYQLTDAPVINSMGISAGYLAVLVLALYVDSPAVSTHYSHPRLLWLLCPLMLYWISRLWIKTSRGEMHDDPLVFSLQDIGSWMVFLAMTCVTLIAI